jgi:Rrf2 family protein
MSALGHRTYSEDFGQLAPIIDDGTMLCAGLPPRVYESLKALCCLASADGPLQAQQIAEAADLPPAQTAKILQLMTWAGFIESRRGTKGGFWLVMPADQIRVTDVADFFARHMKRHAGKGPDGLLKALEAATARCQKEFSRITIADLAKASRCEPGTPAAKKVAKQRQRKAS